MGLLDSVRKVFSSISIGATKPTDKVSATKTITNELLGYLLGLSDFSNLDEDEIYEQLYIWEPEIGGAIDRLSTLVGESYKYCYIKDSGDTMEDIEKEMVETANRIADDIDVRHYFEIFSEMLEIHGDLFLEPDKSKTSLSILPNKYVTLIDDKKRLTSIIGTTTPDQIMTQENYLVLYEGMSGTRILDKSTYIHVKYKDTPVFSVDPRGRTTYGMYCPSPLHRVILPIWWKRQTMIIDIMWRLKNVPREHHMISADMFSLDKYSGDMLKRRTDALADAKSYLDTYVETIKSQMPDQGYATLDTTKIEMIENSNSNYMQTNELISQINDQVWAALNMPKSMILGESRGTYASELVIANYVTQKINQLAHKIKPVIRDIIRTRVRAINPSYPVEKLDIKIELEITATDLEVFRQMAIMAELGVFTESEIREKARYKPLRDDQKDSIVDKSMSSISKQTMGSISSPETPQSSVQHATDKGQNSYRKTER